MGGLAALDVASEDHRERTTTDASISEVDAELSGGPIHIVGTERDVSLTKRVRAGVLGPEEREAVEGDRLVLRPTARPGCWRRPAGWTTLCGPADVAVRCGSTAAGPRSGACPGGRRTGQRRDGRAGLHHRA